MSELAPAIAPEAAVETPTDAPAVPANPMRRRQFRPASIKSKLSADEANRQGRAVRMAFEIMGKDEARAFLNEPDDALGGRPLDVATASAEGMQAVEQALAARRGACHQA